MTFLYKVIVRLIECRAQVTRLLLMLVALNNKNAIAQNLADSEFGILRLLIDGCVHQDVVQRLHVGGI